MIAVGAAMRRNRGVRGRTAACAGAVCLLTGLTDQSICPALENDHRMRAAAIQMNSTGDRPRNRATAERLVRAAAGDGATLVVLPEKWNVLGTPEQLAAGAEPLDGPVDRPGRARLARELRIDLDRRLDRRAAGRRAPGREALRTRASTSAPTASCAASTASCTCSTSRSPAPSTASPTARTRGRRSSPTTLARRAPASAWPICYDLRFPELFRDPRRCAARASLALPSAFTLATTRDHSGGAAARPRDRGPVPRRRRQPDRRAHARARPSGGRSMVVDPWGDGARDRARRRGFRRSPSSTSTVRTRSARDCPRSRTVARTPTHGRKRRWRRQPDGEDRASRRQTAPDPRRGRARVRAHRLPHLPRLRRRRRGGRRLRPRLPLLRLEGPDPRHALPRALGHPPAGDPRGRRRADPAAREALRDHRPSSSTPTATTRT